MRFLGKRPDVIDGAPEFTRVATLLGPADLAAVDALIMAGAAASRSEALRWAVGRIRENPAYAELQQRAEEIDELKGQF
jgi:Arc/MetJ-type ribon-helix-helix transcriptional regulator